MDFSLLLSRVKKLLLFPQPTWREIKREKTSIFELFRHYALYLALVPSLVVLLRYGLLGVCVSFQGVARVSLLEALVAAAVKLLANLLALYVMGCLINYLAVYFDSKSDQISAFKLVVYAVAPLWLAQVFQLVPFLGFLTLLGFYSAYLFYLGLPILLETPSDRVLLFVFFAVLIGIILSGISGVFVRPFLTLPGTVPFF